MPSMKKRRKEKLYSWICIDSCQNNKWPQYIIYWETIQIKSLAQFFKPQGCWLAIIIQANGSHQLEDKSKIIWYIFLAAFIPKRIDATWLQGVRCLTGIMNWNPKLWHFNDATSYKWIDNSRKFKESFLTRPRLWLYNRWSNCQHEVSSLFNNNFSCN